MPKKFHQIGDRVGTGRGETGTLKGAYNNLWLVVLDNGTKAVVNGGNLTAPPEQFNVGDRVVTPGGDLGTITDETLHGKWIVTTDKGRRLHISDANLSPAPENTMTTEMTLNHRQPIPEPRFRQGELAISNKHQMLVVVTEHQANGLPAFSGTVIHPGTSSDHERGETSSGWIADSFTRLDGTVTLEQSP